MYETCTSISCNYISITLSFSVQFTYWYLIMKTFGIATWFWIGYRRLKWRLLWSKSRQPMEGHGGSSIHVKNSVEKWDKKLLKKTPTVRHIPRLIWWPFNMGSYLLCLFLFLFLKLLCLFLSFKTYCIINIVPPIVWVL